MIKIRLDNDKRAHLLDLHKKILQNPYKIQDALNIATRNSIAGTAKHNFYSFIQNDQLQTILFAEPDELHDLNVKLEPLYKLALKENEATLKDELSKIFDYEKFRDNYSGYGAYELVKFLQVNNCPYCNRLSTVTYVGENGRVRPQLDHWLRQAEYPYLSISLYNLIPSCGPCNGNFKKSKTFNLSDYIHPYKEGYELEYKFRYKSALTNDKIKTIEDFSLQLKPQRGIAEGIKQRAKKTIEVFEIEGIYNKEKLKALSIINQSPMYSEEYINAQLKIIDYRTGNKMFKDKLHYIQTAFDLKTNTDEYCLAEHSKFKRDLAEDMGLVF